jgi:hypothetical protein
MDRREPRKRPACLAPEFVGLLAAEILARRQQDADGQDPLFLTPDGNRAATVRHINNWLARVGRETGLRFDRDAGWNGYMTPAWARFRRLESCELLAIHQPVARR